MPLTTPLLAQKDIFQPFNNNYVFLDVAHNNNNLLTDADQVTVTLEMMDIQHEHQSVPTAEDVQQQPQQPPAASFQSDTAAQLVRPSTVPTLQVQNADKLTDVRSSSARTSNTKTNSNGYQSLEDVEDEGTISPMSPIDEQVLEEVLYSRPTLRLGREMSMRFRAQTAIPSRRKRVYKSLPHGAKRPKTTSTLSTGIMVCVYVCMCVCVYNDYVSVCEAV